MDKIYSRNRIKIYKLSKIKVLIIVILFLIIIFIIYYIHMAYPVIVASCENAAYSSVTNIVTTEIKNIMQEYTYSDLINVEKDNEGKIVFLKSNVIVMNEIIAKINQNIQQKIDEQERIKVFINMGTLTGLSNLRFIGPKFEIEFEAAGDCFVSLESKFESAGINQTIHKIYVNTDSFVKIITPFGAFEKDIKATVLLTEAIIVGDVPETYYNLESVEEDEILKYKD